jgi:hypothetical protein
LYLYADNPNLYTEIMIIHLVSQQYELAVYLQLLTLLEILVILYTTLSMTTKNNSVVPIKNLQKSS